MIRELRVLVDHLENDQVVCVSGNSKQLGKWQSDALAEMTKDKTNLSVVFDIALVSIFTDAARMFNTHVLHVCKVQELGVK